MDRNSGIARIRLAEFGGLPGSDCCLPGETCSGSAAYLSRYSVPLQIRWATYVADG